MQNRKFFLLTLVTVSYSFILSTKTIAGSIDILESADLGPNTVAVETSTNNYTLWRSTCFRIKQDVFFASKHVSKTMKATMNLL